ncbi:MAG TPA: TetR/AcrR family transcriptional regulator [Bacillota bacterium]|jgi:AcrR family transcriptional regulator|nr:TetR/AcrR family transcriptional regulator [Fastidiosipila sp.]HPX93180.1 TetR/AcrR family transcriptional regulator [Bacillota bacterium]HQB81493.1 TetR/AcrR family transcriptional regulator [Bacillota bacterium]
MTDNKHKRPPPAGEIVIQPSGGDRRSRRTALALQQGLVELLLKKPLQEITISELTGTADVSRTTFYLHYRNIGDLFQQMEDNIYLQFEQLIHQSMTDEQSLLYIEPDEKGAPTMPVLKEVFLFIKSNPELSVVLLNNPDSTFLNKIWSTGHDVLIERLASFEPHMDVNQIEYYYLFVINGIRGLIEHWIASDMREPVQELVEIATGFVLRNMGFLLWGDGERPQAATKHSEGDSQWMQKSSN